MKRLIKLLIILFIVYIFINIWQNLDLTDKILAKLYPTQYSEHVEKYSEEFNVDKNLIYAIIKAESNFNPEAKSSREAVGLMQIMESTAEETAQKLNIKIEDLHNPETNIMLGVKYFADLIDVFNGNYKLAIIAYNAGMGNVQKWIEEDIIRRRWRGFRKCAI